MPLPRSPLAPEAQPELPPIAGVKLTGAACGIRYSGRKDLMVMELAEGTSVAGVFTRSSTRAAPVLILEIEAFLDRSMTNSPPLSTSDSYATNSSSARSPLKSSTQSLA